MSKLSELMYDAYNAQRKDKPELLTAVAAELINLRETCSTPDGRTDWAGRSYAYRMMVNAALGEANVPLDDRTRFLDSIRYHTSKVLHERLDDTQLAEYGLRSLDSTERARETRDKLRAERLASRRVKDNLAVLARGKKPRDPEAVRAMLLKMLADLDA